ncbi:MAG: ArsB/NhaD family transporter [Chloroflexi bacterium]|jgi:Na+/H+ antiporter NhaD/arsenite permease-like protein|nr:ArsB/NhaD family transporter [Chloroflexota bacterium]MBT3668630.1 ArsB/NhaD family transporter [Chloroflexota bacterium]MBT4002373.1 ArsB/NhaD family transporter [Chloroflexota bacterium]MBT4304432.1 ArsB/NhaD family transporter [Chloroflexota bacterium]MBT4532894.1 ArsB/NhaD family transporter [Chloroflexota bacterium]
MNPLWLAGSIFLLTYALIVSEKIHRTISALLGGLAMILFVVPQETAFHAIDWNVIFLLAGMMIIANVIKETGLFQWIAFQAVNLGKGDPFRVLVILSLITAVSSAFLDNVTIVVLIAPVTLFVASSLRVSPVPFLIAEILASNIGGMATLVGDPPNILIGSAANIDFLTFIANMGPISVIILLVFILMSRFMFKKDLVIHDDTATPISDLDASSLITDPKLLRKSLIIMTGVILGFLFHGALHLEPATIALIGAVFLMLWSKSDPHYALRDIEWTTLFFFFGLFITVEAIVEVGLIEIIADLALDLTGGDVSFTSILLIWFSAIASGIVDNIPYTATMIPIVKSLTQVMPAEPLWWSLALGACLGGNLTIVGAAANVIVVSLADKSGHPISFKHFLRYGFLTTFMSLVLASGYVWIRYL